MEKLLNLLALCVIGTFVYKFVLLMLCMLLAIGCIKFTIQKDVTDEQEH